MGACMITRKGNMSEPKGIGFFIRSNNGIVTGTSEILEVSENDIVSYKLFAMAIVNGSYHAYAYFEYSDDKSTWTTLDTLHVQATYCDSKQGSVKGHKYYRMRGSCPGDSNIWRSLSGGVAFVGNIN